MFHPHGSQPPSVYWRRRLFLVGSLVLVVVLGVLTVNAVRSTGDGRADAGSPATSSTSAASTSRSSVASRTASPASGNRSTKRPSKAGSSAKPVTSTSAAADCDAGDLQLRSVTGKSAYQVGDTPLLQLQVTNTGPQPCVQNLADKQVELQVYNGESRIWGSHDCKVEAGTTDRTLTPYAPVLVSIKWSGLTSKPGCSGTRQRVGPGTYTLYSSLAGHSARATQFTFG